MQFFPTTPTSSAHPWVRTLVASSLLLFASCSDSDDAPSGPPPSALTLGASFDRAQEVGATTLGRTLRVTVRNAAPDLGTLQTPLWFGLHDGSFDLYDLGAPASAELERLAEDGNLAPLTSTFDGAPGTLGQGTIGGGLVAFEGPLSQGESASVTLRVDPTQGPLYFSFASMILPSNDAFVANGDPMAHQVYDGAGNFQPLSFSVVAADARDAGTEFNDEAPMNTAFFGQSMPDTGTPEGGLVAAHPGFLAPGMGGILDDPNFANADFAGTPGYRFLTITVTEEVPSLEPTGVASLFLNAAGDRLDYDLTAIGLSGEVTGLHLHAGAPGVDGPVLMPLAYSTAPNGQLLARGFVNLTPAQAQAVRAGETYLNAHTALNPDGEVRAQVLAGQVFAGELDRAQQGTSVLGSNLRVIVQNRAPASGTFQTPVWLGVHSGAFDLYNLASPAPGFVERLAEDGTTTNVTNVLRNSMVGFRSTVVAGTQFPGPLAPGETAQTTLRVNPGQPLHRYLSWASMVIPSNDAFVANADPMAHELFDATGTFVGVDFSVPASDVRDAGTEVNDEEPANTAFFGQSTPNTGVDQGGVIDVHPGFLAPGLGGILDDPMFQNADFAHTAGYEMLRVFLREGPTPLEPRGTVTWTLANDESSAHLRITAVHLSGPVTAAHIHRAPAGSDGTIQVHLTSHIVHNEAGALVLEADLPLNADQVAALRAGELYVNLHTDLNPQGEIRAQL